jgi:benzoyl-CoA reductase/2-hydroxyglutaryl-CoA dehydratase subunit BcrC/BadD/HgdB
VTVKAGSAVERLAWHYEHPFAQAMEKARAGTPVVGITSNTVPWELLRAAGYFPLMLNPSRGPSPFATQFMEDGVFSTRIRGIFDGLVSGAWPFLKLVVIPRTSEQEHKLYLYLREVVRQGFATALPDLYLYNLLHARSREAEAYGLQRTREFKGRLEDRTGRRIDAAELVRAAEESNQAARAISRLLDLRRGAEPRLTGSQALALVGAVYFMDRAEYAQLAGEAAAEISLRPPVHGARILIKGSPLHHTGLHRAIEAQRAAVVAEDDWWGSRGIANEITTSGDIVRSIFETYYFDAPSPRVFPRKAADEWFLAATADIDGVVFYLPPEDDVLAWDYPEHRKSLDQRGIPSLPVREDAAELSPACHRRIEEFITSVSPTSSTLPTS